MQTIITLFVWGNKKLYLILSHCLFAVTKTHYTKCYLAPVLMNQASLGCTPQLTCALCHRNGPDTWPHRSVDHKMSTSTLDLIKVLTWSVDPTLDLIEVSTSKCQPQHLTSSKCWPQSVDHKVSTTKCPSGKSVTVNMCWLVFMWCILQY